MYLSFSKLQEFFPGIKDNFRMSVIAIVDPVKGLLGLDKHKIDNFVFRFGVTSPPPQLSSSLAELKKAWHGIDKDPKHLALDSFSEFLSLRA